jgi:ABC-type antimicrobial peptide transport system permease subunit
VVFAILLVAANTMVMAIRERTSEIGVLKTLGFEDGTVFRMVLIEAASSRSAAAARRAGAPSC